MHGAKKDEKSGAHHVFVASCIVGSLFYVSRGWGLRCKSNTRIKNENRRKRRPTFVRQGSRRKHMVGEHRLILQSLRGAVLCLFFVMHNSKVGVRPRHLGKIIIESRKTMSGNISTTDVAKISERSEALMHTCEVWSKSTVC